MSNTPNNNNNPGSMWIGIILCILAGVLFFSTCGDTGSSNKSYAQQYGYDVEDFYYKGSDGLWYKK